MSATSTRLGKAVAIAAVAHLGQVDKGGEAYILHPLRLMHKAEPRGESAMIVAVLHDVREDCDDLEQFDFSFLTEDENIALDNLTRRTNESYEDFVERCGSHPLSLDAKIDDITHNMDGSRMPLHREITRKDLARWEKYRISLIRLYRIKRENDLASV